MLSGTSLENKEVGLQPSSLKERKGVYCKYKESEPIETDHFLCDFGASNSASLSLFSPQNEG